MQIKNYEGKDIRFEYDETEGKYYFAAIDILNVLFKEKSIAELWLTLKPDVEVIKIRMQTSEGETALTDCITKEDTMKVINKVPNEKIEKFSKWIDKIGKKEGDFDQLLKKVLRVPNPRKES